MTFSITNLANNRFFFYNFNGVPVIVKIQSLRTRLKLQPLRFFFNFVRYVYCYPAAADIKYFRIE